MAVVPMSRSSAAAGPRSAGAPLPDEKYLLMAAAQMHAEGRLVQSGVPATTQGGAGAPPPPPPQEYFPSDGNRTDTSMMT